MIATLREAYAMSTRFTRALPWIVAIVIVAEFAQHVVEIRIGMYDSMMQAKAVQDAPARLLAGHLKVLVIALLGYCVTRFLGHGDDAKAATQIDMRAVRLYVWVLAYNMLWIVVGLDIPSILRGAGVGTPIAGRLTLVAVVTGFALGLLLHPWIVAAALGNAAIGFGRSIRLSLPHAAWILGFTLVAVLPLMGLHYVLFYAAIGLPPILVWAVALLDAGVVGFLGVLIVAVGFIVARRIADASGVGLLPAD